MHFLVWPPLHHSVGRDLVLIQIYTQNHVYPGSGIAAYYLGATSHSRGFDQLVGSGITPSTIAVNGAVSLLIAARLLYAQRLLSQSQANFVHVEQKRKANPYMTALAICVESSALIVVATLASIVCQDFIVVVPQISVSDFLL